SNHSESSTPPIQRKPQIMPTIAFSSGRRLPTHLVLFLTALLIASACGTPAPTPRGGTRPAPTNSAHPTPPRRARPRPPPPRRPGARRPAATDRPAGPEPLVGLDRLVRHRST